MTAATRCIALWLVVVPLAVGVLGATLPHTVAPSLSAMSFTQAVPDDDDPEDVDDVDDNDNNDDDVDPWGFEDDEAEVETWSSLIRDQGVDLAMLTGFATLALISFFRKSAVLKYVTFVAAVVYLGVAKSQLISVVNIYGVLTGTLPVFRYNLAWYLFAGFTVVSTVLWGRLYCGRVCAFGALTQMMDRVVPARMRVDVPAWLERHAARVKYGLLVAVILYFLTTGEISAYRYVEPFWMFTGQASVGLWTALAILLVATLFVRNLYCRFLCPVGAALGLLSNLTVFKIKRWSECNNCKVCEKACEWGAIQGPAISVAECVRCDDCERLYADTKKCPHWLILFKKRKTKKIPLSVVN